MFISVYQIWTSKYTECLDYFRIVGCRLWNLQVIKSTKHINIDENMERKKASSQITMKNKGSSESTRGPSLVLTNCPVSVYNIMPAWSSLPPPCDDICLFCTNFLSSAHYIFHFHLFLPLCVCVSEYILMWPCFMHWRKGAGAASIVLQFSASDEEIKVYSFAPPASPYFYSCAPNKTNRSNYIYIYK